MKRGRGGVPVGEQGVRHGRVGVRVVALHHRAQLGRSSSPSGSSSTISVFTRPLDEVQHVGDPAGHAGGEVAPGRSEHDHAPAGHVLAAVVADALDDGHRAGVADAEALADLAAQERLAGRRAVEDDVAGDDVLLGDERGVGVRADDDPPAGQALAEVVVGVADEPQRDAARQERAEATARPSR